MNEVLDLYNKWVATQQVAERFRNQYFEIKKDYGYKLKYPMSPEHKQVYDDFCESSQNKWVIEGTLFSVLDSKVFQLPSGDFLVPCYDDGMNECIQIREEFKSL